MAENLNLLGQESIYVEHVHKNENEKLREAGIYASSLSIAIMVFMKRAKFYVYVLTSLYLARLLISKFLEYMSGFPTPARLAS